MVNQAGKTKLDFLFFIIIIYFLDLYHFKIKILLILQKAQQININKTALFLLFFHKEQTWLLTKGHFCFKYLIFFALICSLKESACRRVFGMTCKSGSV